MNMKKLIQQADFDNVQQISKRWKKQNTSKPVLINQSDSNLIEVLNQSQTHKQNFPDPNVVKLSCQNFQKQFQLHSIHQIPQKKRQVIPQIIDQDTEHFRNRLQHLLNTFKTDAVGEFMSMKKSMLEYQKETVKNDTQKYLTMYQQKHQELLQTKQKLIEITKQAEKKTIQCQLMSNHIAKLNQRVKITKYLSRPFALLYENKQREKMIKFKFQEAEKKDNRKKLIIAFNGWRNIFREAKQIKNKQLTEKTIQNQVNQIVGKFQKEMEMLKQQLSQALSKNQQFQNNKHIMQENLKKAFLRGVCAMNMEAMGVLQGDPNNQQVNNNNHMNISNIENLPNLTMNHSMMNMTQKSPHSISSTNIQNSSVLIGKIKTQSKQHKWKEAPIMGLENQTQYEQPRPILVKPSTQGKVIKIIDGKSSTMANSTISNINSGTDRKKVGMNSNNNLSQTSKSMVNSRKKI